VSFLGARSARGESWEGRTFAGTVVCFGLSAGAVEGVNLHYAKKQMKVLMNNNCEL
jgi:hypothetical protein